MACLPVSDYEVAARVSKLANEALCPNLSVFHLMNSKEKATNVGNDDVKRQDARHATLLIEQTRLDIKHTQSI